MHLSLPKMKQLAPIDSPHVVFNLQVQKIQEIGSWQAPSEYFPVLMSDPHRPWFNLTSSISCDFITHIQNFSPRP